MMTLAGWEEKLKAELRKEGFSMERPNLALGWEVFRRLLAEPVEDDFGAFVLGRVVHDHLAAVDDVFELRFGREACADGSSWPVISLVMHLRPPDALAAREFSIAQRVDDTSDLIDLDEFLDRCFVDANFNAALTHAGGWMAEVYHENFGT